MSVLNKYKRHQHHYHTFCTHSARNPHAFYAFRTTPAERARIAASFARPLASFSSCVKPVHRPRINAPSDRHHRTKHLATATTARTHRPQNTTTHLRPPPRTSQTHRLLYWLCWQTHTHTQQTLRGRFERTELAGRPERAYVLVRALLAAAAATAATAATFRPRRHGTVRASTGFQKMFVEYKLYHCSQFHFNFHTLLYHKNPAVLNFPLLRTLCTIKKVQL
jgi:hypothetical protein